MTDINEIKRELEVLTAKVAAYEAEKATKRSWPERIEAGMCFAHGDRKYVFFGRLVNMDTANAWAISDDPFGGDKEEFTYLGKIDLTIRTDAHEPVEGIDERRQKYANASEYYAAARAPKAHEPTGAELVGRVCEFADLMSGPWSPGECAAFGQNPAYPYRKAGGAEWKFARLTK